MDFLTVQILEPTIHEENEYAEDKDYFKEYHIRINRLGTVLAGELR